AISSFNAALRFFPKVITLRIPGARDSSSGIITASMMQPANRFSALLCLLIFAPMSSPSQDRTEARSMVISRHGIVATSQTLASQAGAPVPATRGAARDAALAPNAALVVVEPMSNGIGGDLFAIYWEAKS